MVQGYQDKPNSTAGRGLELRLRRPGLSTDRVPEYIELCHRQPDQRECPDPSFSQRDGQTLNGRF